MPALASAHVSHHHDEDFINKSLLASLDAQADAEPLDDSDHPDGPDDHYHRLHRPRPDSPPDGNFHHPDSLYAMHPNLYDYTNDFDANKYLPKLNGFPANNYRASFTSYPNTTRARLGHQPSQSNYRDSPSFYPPSDAFSQQITSPVMQPYDPRQSYDYNPQPNGAHKSYLVDQYPAHKPPAQQQQPYAAPYSNGVQLSSQTPYGPHVPAMGGSNNPAVPPGLSASVSMANGSNTTSSGEEISTIFVVGFPEDMQEREFQNMFTFSSGFEAATLKIPNKEYTAYGSLVGGPPPGSTLPNPPGALRGPGSFQYAGPNDPYNLVTVNQGGVVVDGGRDGTMASWPAPAQQQQLADELGAHYLPGQAGAAALGLGMGGPNLNLNLPPRKQIIGFAKFRSREEALSARDTLQGRRVDIEKGAVLKAEMAKKNLHTKRGVGPVPGAGVGMPGGLQQQQSQQQGQQQQSHNGLSVAGLDAFNIEPAFSPAAGAATATTTASNRDSLQAISRLGGWRDSVVGAQPTGQLQQTDTSSTAVNGLPTNTNEEERDRKRDSVLSLGLGVAALSLGGTPTVPTSVSSVVAASVSGSQRGPRERAEDHERDREQLRRRKEIKDVKEREREMNLMRLRATNAAAYDAFHGVPASAASTAPVTNGVGANGMSRQSSTTSTTSASSGGVAPLWASSSTAPTTESVAVSSPMLEVAQEQPQEEEAAQDEHAPDHEHPQEEIVGPWDRINVNAGFAAAAVGRPTSESERSLSPPPGLDGQHYPPQQGYQYQPQFMHLHEQQQAQAALAQAQAQQQQQYHSSSQSESSESAADNQNQSHDRNPIGYVGARLGFVQSQTIFSRGYVTLGASSASAQQPPSGAGTPPVAVNANGPSPVPNANAITTNAISTAATTNTTSSGSSAAGSATGGTTSPQLPSPASASGSGSGSTTSAISGISGLSGSGMSATNGLGGVVVGGLVRGTVDQNPPINTLYVGNLPTSPPPIGYPSDYLEETLREVFSARPGYRKLCFRHKANGPMCFVEFEDVQFAAKALVEMSGNTLRGAVKNGIRLSYSKNPLGVRTPTSGGSNAGGPTLQQQQQLMQTLSHHHHHQQQYHHGQQMGPPPSSASSTATNSTSLSGAPGQDPTFQSRLADDFGVGGHVAPLHLRGALPTTILRRDSVLSPTTTSSLAQAQAAQGYLSSSGSSSGSGGGGGSSNPNSFFSSPPPRFYTTSPGSGMAFGTASSTPLTGASSAFVPRSAAANGVGGGGMFNGGNFTPGGGYGGSQQATFSPFGVPPFANEGPFGHGQPPIPHLQPLSIPGEHQQHHQQQGGMGDD